MDAYIILGAVLQVFFELAVCELSAYSVIGKPAWLSTTHSAQFAAAKAVDGNLATIAHSQDGDPHPVLRIDLEEEVCVGRVTTTLRDSGCGQEPCFLGTVIRAGLSPNYHENQPCGSPGTVAQSAPGAVSRFLCDAPRLARYVTLDIDPSGPNVTDPTLKIAEVQIEVYTTGECDAVKEPAAYVRLSGQFRMLYEQGSISNPNPLSTRKTSSRIRCSSYCLKRADCSSFDFAATEGQCRLFSQSSAEDIEMTPNNDFNIYVRDNN